MILRENQTSPFARIVKLAVNILGMADKVTYEAADPEDAGDTLRTQNPLGKMPVLVDNGRGIYDTRVILEHIDELAGGGKIIPSGGAARLDCNIGYALATGILDAAIMIAYERRLRPEEHRLQSIVDRHRGKITRSLDAMAEQDASYKGGATPDISTLAIGVTLDYLDLRKPVDWREHCPDYTGFMKDFAASVPGYAETLPPDIPPADWR